MKVAVFIDYDNLLELHKKSGVLAVTTRALMQIPWFPPVPRGTCDVRIYGGWYEGSSMTVLAQNLAVEIQNEFPAIIRVPHSSGNITSLAATAELAYSMLEEPSHHMFDTFRKKGKPANIRVQSPSDIGCVDASCVLPLAKNLLKKGSCPIATCTVGACDLVYRHEQKIVDTLLTCDMIHAASLDYEHVILVSGDDDFLPPVRSLVLRGRSVARFHPRPNPQRVPVSILGNQLTDIDL